MRAAHLNAVVARTQTRDSVREPSLKTGAHLQPTTTEPTVNSVATLAETRHRRAVVTTADWVLGRPGLSSLPC